MSALYQGQSCTVILDADQLTPAGQCPYCGQDVKATPTIEADILNVQNGNYTWPEYKKTPAPAGWQPHAREHFVDMWTWGREQKRCFRHIVHLRNAYKIASGNLVDIDP